MSIYQTLAMTTGAILSFAAINAPVQATTFFEVGDAGDTFNSAQVVSGLGDQVLDRIEGRLTSTQDSDYFRFFFSRPGVMQIDIGPYFNTPFPLNTFPAFQLFNANSSLMGGYWNGNFTFGEANIGGSSITFSSGMAQLIFHNLPTGEYVLKVDGTGQANEQRPIHQGDYAVKLSGAEFIPCESVPEPSILVGTVVAGSIGWLMKRKRASSKDIS